MAMITDILALPGKGLSLAEAVLSVGLVLDGQQVVWGAVAVPAVQVAALVASVEQKVGPLLRGRPLTSYREMTAVINDFAESVARKQVVAQALPPPGTVSRRALLSGFQAEPVALATEAVTTLEGLPAALRDVLGQALLQAVAWQQGCSLLGLIRQEYGFGGGGTAVPLLAEIDPHRPLSVQSVSESPLVAIGYTLSGNNPLAELGENGEVLQRFAQQLKEQLVGLVEPASLAFHFNVRGGYGQLCGHNLGQILGLLYSLEEAAKPFLVRLQDPFVLADGAEQIERMAKLKGYLGSRRLRLELVAGIGRAADALAFAEAGAAHMVHLHGPQMGGIAEMVTAVQYCQQNRMATLWGGSPEETEIAARVGVQAALAVQPTMMLVKFGRLGSAAPAFIKNEMGRILAGWK